ncbi:alpha/beta hydrolase [Sphingosinicella rhizophila]|uniref:Alpha/beta hydrolase-fold protein n=1 Tax=Sphingosinicella rhizophila TaxID=3050082 RepID=A0ABU3QBE7_9SPHN|nr:alpha/beta hydrolase-fold protein [Sphingosinicella sp. GR2756]MDT9600729.1 alpha/beta hydrolase-fold protein [Sphingosinicella sp. GR2756]
MRVDLGPAVPMAGLYDSRFHEMEASANGESYRIFVGGPASPFVGGAEADQGQKYPVIYVLDGKLGFAMVHAQCQVLSALGQLPPVYVVGIGYAGDESFFEKDVVHRYRDLTPDAGGALERAMLGLNTVSRDGEKGAPGGGPAFLAFLRDELKPAIEAAYPVDPGDATLLGNSLGGLFPSWILFNQPELFQRYVIISPSWWWNDYEMWRWEQAYADRHDDLAAKVFVAAGGLETLELQRAMVERLGQAVEGEMKSRFDAFLEAVKIYGWPRMVELMPEFAAKLASRSNESLDLLVIDLPEETHESIPGAAFSRGLRFVFGAWRPAKAA